MQISGSSPYELRYGYCRAQRIGDQIWVSGCAPIEPDGSSTPGGVGAQARRCLDVIAESLAALGASNADVVRTRMYIVDPADADAVGREHGRVFAKVRPVSTMVVVTGLLRDEWRVEIEAEALVRT